MNNGNSTKYLRVFKDTKGLNRVRLLDHSNHNFMTEVMKLQDTDKVLHSDHCDVWILSAKKSWVQRVSLIDGKVKTKEFRFTYDINNPKIEYNYQFGVDGERFIIMTNNGDSYVIFTANRNNDPTIEKVNIFKGEDITRS